MKRIGLAPDDKSYHQIIHEKLPSILTRFLKESLPISLFTAAYSHFDPKINVITVIGSTLTFAILSRYVHGNSYQKEANDYPGGLEDRVRTIGDLINFADCLHGSFAMQLIAYSVLNGCLYLKNKIVLHLSSK